MCGVFQTQDSAGSSVLRFRLSLMAAILGFYLMFGVWPGLFRFVGIVHYRGWFLDSHAILAASDAAASGANPYVINPLDAMGRPHVYSRWWLGLSSWGMTREDNFLLGGSFVVLFLAALAVLLRPRSAGEAAWYFALAVSPAVLLGVERANNDLVIFALLALTAVCLACNNAWGRWLALVPWAAATLLKFYPAVAVVAVAAAPRPKESVARGVAAAMLLGALGIWLIEDYRAVAAFIPKANGMHTLGAWQIFAAAGLPQRSAVACGLLTGILTVVAIVYVRRRDAPSAAGAPMLDETAFLVGTLMLLGCFFTGTSYAYRYIYGLMMAPWLWKRARDPAVKPTERRWAVLAVILLPAVLWFDGMVLGLLSTFADSNALDDLLRIADGIALCWLPAVWALMIGLTYLVAGYVVRLSAFCVRIQGG